MTRGQIALLVVLGVLVLAVYTVLGLLVTGRIPIGLPPAPTDVPVATATAIPPLGTSRQNPMPFGQSVLAENLEIHIAVVHRDAWSRISPLNAPLQGDSEVVLLEVEVKNVSPAAVSISPGVFRLTGDSSRLYQRPPLILDDELRGTVEAGETLAGSLAFVIEQGEENLVLAYIPSGSVPDSSTRWLWADESPDPEAFAAAFISPTASPRAGGSRLAPALMHYPVAADDRLEISVLSVQREAWPLIQEMSPFNQPPEPGMEYVLVYLRTRFYGEDDDLNSVNWWSFRMMGAENILYPNPSLILRDELKGELFPGGEMEGYLAFQVRRGEKNLILLYDPTGVGVKLEQGVRWLWATESPDYALLRTPVPASSALPISGRTSQQPAPTGVPVLTESQMELVVEGATLLDEGALRWDRWDLAPIEAGRRYLVVTVKIRNLSDVERPQAVHWQGFVLQEPYGSAFYKATVLGGSELEGEMFPGATVAAHLAFPVVRDGQFLLSYDPTGLREADEFRWFAIEM